MPHDNLQSIFNALPFVLGPDLHKQWNRTTYFLGELQARPGRIVPGGGKYGFAEAVEFTGATAQTVAEGADVPDSEFAQDIDVPAVLPWATYRTSFYVTEQEIDAARSSGQAAPEAMRDIFGTRILGAGAVLASQIEADALSGTGVDGNGNPTLIGIFGGAVSASGVYAGLNPATYSEWAASVLSNGGVARNLTTDLIEQADQNIFVASSLPWNLIMTTAAVTRKYAGFFQSGPPGTNFPLVRMNDSAGKPVYGLGLLEDSQTQYDTLFMKGRRVYRNRLVPSGQLALLNTDHIQIKYLPRALSDADKDFMRMMGVEGSSGGAAPIQATGIPMRLVVLAKTGDSIKVSARITLAMAVLRRNSMALIQNIQET